MKGLQVDSVFINRIELTLQPARLQLAMAHVSDLIGGEAMTFKTLHGDGYKIYSQLQQKHHAYFVGGKGGGGGSNGPKVPQQGQIAGTAYLFHQVRVYIQH